MNGFKTAFLMTLMMMLFLLIGQALGGEQGMIIAFIIALGMNFIAYWFSDKIILKAYGGKEVTERYSPKLYGIVKKLSGKANISIPKLYIIPSDTPNAFATGRNPKNGAIAVTRGIMNILNDTELEGVIAHELAHIRNRDILIATVTATIVGTITALARVAGFAMLFFGRGQGRDAAGAMTQLALIILAPLAAVIIQLAISRAREYIADSRGAKICGKPSDPANALRKLESTTLKNPMRNVEPSTSHMFIVNPLRGGGMSKLFSTHPPVSERVKRLEAMTAE